MDVPAYIKHEEIAQEYILNENIQIGQTIKKESGCCEFYQGDAKSSTLHTEADYYTPDKVRRLDKIQEDNTKSQNKTLNKCHNCIDFKSYVDTKFKQLADQNSAILDSLATNNILLTNLIRQDTGSCSAALAFPLTTEEDLQNVDRSICDENLELYISAVKSLIRNDLCKNFQLILSEQLILDFNLDGTHGKHRFKDFKNMYNVLKRVIEADSTVEDPEGQIREAFKKSKKRHFQKVCSARKKLCDDNATTDGNYFQDY